MNRQDAFAQRLPLGEERLRVSEAVATKERQRLVRAASPLGRREER